MSVSGVVQGHLVHSAAWGEADHALDVGTPGDGSLGNSISCRAPRAEHQGDRGLDAKHCSVRFRQFTRQVVIFR